MRQTSTKVAEPDRSIALDTVSSFVDVFRSEKEALDEVLQRVQANPDAIIRACDLLLTAAQGNGQAHRVIVSGVGKAGLIARKVSATLSSTGTAAVYLQPVDALHGDLGFVRPSDCALLFSYSGETVELLRLARELSRVGCPILAVTQDRTTTLGQMATVCLEIGEVREACYLGLAPTSTTTVMLAIGDALALTVARRTGFTEADFGRNHPAGSLGLRFRSVRDLMRTGARLICVHSSSKLKEVIRLVSAAKTGAAIVTDADGRLMGIFTDGDLRRALLQGGDVLEREVREFASIPCRYVQSSHSVAEALKILQNTRIEDLPVVDRRRVVVGMLCLKDISVY